MEAVVFPDVPNEGDVGTVSCEQPIQPRHTGLYVNHLMLQTGEQVKYFASISDIRSADQRSFLRLFAGGHQNLQLGNVEAPQK